MSSYFDELARAALAQACTPGGIDRNDAPRQLARLLRRGFVVRQYGSPIYRATQRGKARLARSGGAATA